MNMKQNLALVALVIALTFSAIPNANAQWAQTNGPFGSDVNAFASLDSTLFVATEEGIFLSSDTGATWTDRSEGLPSVLTQYLVTMGTELFAASDSNISYSLDHGATWVPTAWHFGGIANLYAHDSTIYAIGAILGAYTLCLYCSTDQGVTWTSSPIPSTEYTGGILWCDSVLFYATSGGLFRSTDNGNTWNLSDSGIYTTYGIGSGIPFEHDGVILAAFGDVVGGIDIYRSTDRGVSWKIALINAIDVSAGFTAIGNTLYGGSTYSNTIYTTTDDGDTWASHEEFLGGISSLFGFGGKLFIAKVYTVAITSDVSGFGIYRSDDSAQTWNFSNVGISKTDVYSLAASDSTIFSAIVGGMRYSSNDGEQWQSSSMSSFGDYLVKQVVAYDSTVVIYDESDSLDLGMHRVYYSLDNGRTFTLSGGLEDANIYCLANIDSTFFVGTDDGIYLSVDHGRSWSIVQDSGVTFFGVLDMAVIGKTILASVYDRSGTPMGLLKSTDYGTSWEVSDTGTVGKEFEGISHAGGLLFANAYNHGIYRSTDCGSTWSSIGLNDSSVIFAIASNDNALVASIGVPGFSNVSVSWDSGLTWNSVSVGLGVDSANVTSLCIYNNYVIAGTWEDGVWKCDIHDILGDNGENNVNRSIPILTTFNCYPNPFSQSTTISFTSPESGTAEVSVVNILGTTVARIFSGELDAGQHSFVWGASALSPGMYECVVSVDGNVQRIPISHLR